MEITVDATNAIDALKELRTIMDVKAHEIMVDVMSELEKWAVTLCPVNTGTLRSRIHYTWKTPLEAVLEDGTNYGVFVELGTEPHEIKPFARKALHWKKDEKDYFAKKVFHPGTNPQPFFMPARNMTINKLPEIVERRLK